MFERNPDDESEERVVDPQNAPEENQEEESTQDEESTEHSNE
jgi:hypothetical protein